jgi:hypothetical protein
MERGDSSQMEEIRLRKKEKEELVHGGDDGSQADWSMWDSPS